MNISFGTKNRIQIKANDALAYLASDMNDLGDGDMLILSSPTQKFYSHNIIYTAGEFDIKGVMVFGYKLEDQITYHINTEDINIVYMDKPLSAESKENDEKRLENIGKCDILITSITEMKDLTPLIEVLSPKVICVPENFEDAEKFEKVKTYKIRSFDAEAGSENTEFVVLQK